MDVRVNDDEFAILEWLHRKHDRAAADVQDFLAPVLRDQLRLDEARYNRARDFLRHFEFIALREAELESGEKVEAIKLTPDGENFYRHAIHSPDRHRFDPSGESPRVDESRNDKR